MDASKRQITKIAREVGRFTASALKKTGAGTAEYDFVHVVRKNPGITQAGVREILGIDKGAAARRTANLIKKGYITAVPNPDDRRSALLYATEAAEALKTSKASVEAMCYQWLLGALTPGEREQFTALLDKVYLRSKAESKAGFPNLGALAAEKNKTAPEE